MKQLLRISRLTMAQRPSNGEALAGACGVGFIGLGRQAKHVLLPAMRRSSDVRLTAAVAATRLGADYAVAKLGFAIAATDPRAVIEDNETRLVVITSRRDAADLAIRALEAGKHVVCEAPLGSDRDGLASLAAAEAAAPGRLSVIAPRRFAPMLRRAKAALENCGAPLVMSYRVNAAPIATEVLSRRGDGRGPIAGEVAEVVDAMVYLCGALPVEVQAIKVGPHNDAVSSVLRFTDGSTGVMVHSSLGDGAMPREFFEAFSAGCAIQIDNFCKVTIWRDGRRRTLFRLEDRGHAAMAQALVDAAMGRSTRPFSWQEMEAGAEAGFAIFGALDTGSKTTIGAH